MPRKPRQLPAQNTLPYLLLTLTALCGEYPIRQISHLPGGSAYLESVVTALRRDGLLRTFSKDGLRGLRLTSSAKRLLLADAPEWFSAYLTGSSEPNKLKSEIPRRLRLHRMAEILTIMHNADIPAFPWEKAPFSAASQSAAIPAYYTSREVKEIGPQGAKIKSSRATGILLTDSGIFLTYNTAKAQMKWEYKAELRFKALLQTEGAMPDAEISGIVFGSTMEQLSALMQPDAHSYFLLDGSFPHFYYLTNDRYGIAGHNYVKLRDIGKAVGFNVFWDVDSGCVQIETGAPYTGEAPSAEAVPSAAAPSDVDAAKQDIVARTNALRAERGIAALTADDQLMRAAQVRADEMAATGNYSHTRPDGRKYYTVTDCRQVGENIHQIPLLYLAQQKTALAEALVYSWSKSAGHMENMTDESYAAIGVGLARGTDANGLECWYCVQLFLRSGYSISAVDKPATK